MDTIPGGDPEFQPASDSAHTSFPIQQTEEDETEEPGTSVDPVFDRVLEQQPPHKTPPRDAKDIRLSVEDIDETLQEEKKVFVDVLTREEQITFSVPAAALLFLAIAQVITCAVSSEWYTGKKSENGTTKDAWFSGTAMCVRDPDDETVTCTSLVELHGAIPDKLLVVWFFLCVFVFAALVALLLIAYFLLLAAPSRNLRRAQYMAMGTLVSLLGFWAAEGWAADVFEGTTATVGMGFYLYFSAEACCLLAAALLSWATRKVPPDMEMAPDHTRQDDVMVTDGVVELTAEGLYTFAHQEEVLLRPDVTGAQPVQRMSGGETRTKRCYDHVKPPGDGGRTKTKDASR